MATAKKTTQAAPAKKTTKAAAPAGIRPIKDTFTKGALTNHLAEQSGVEPKAVKAVLAALEATVLGSVNKKGAGGFTLPANEVLQLWGHSPLFNNGKIDGNIIDYSLNSPNRLEVNLNQADLKKLKDAAL